MLRASKVLSSLGEEKLDQRGPHPKRECRAVGGGISMPQITQTLSKSPNDFRVWNQLLENVETFVRLPVSGTGEGRCGLSWIVA